MTFLEFLEAVGRVAEQMAIPHPEEDAQPIDDDDITDEQRDVYRAKPLHTKIEILIYQIAKNCLTGAQFRQHQNIVKQYKKAKIHPNNIDVGNLKLQ